MKNSRSSFLPALILPVLATACTALEAAPESGDGADSTLKAAGDDCPVASPYRNDAGVELSYTEMFGEGTLEKLRCNEYRKDVKIVMQVNAALDSNNRMYGFRNLPNVLNDLSITHGITDWKVAIIIHSGGYPFVLDPRVDEPHPRAYTKAQTTSAPRADELFEGRTEPLAPYEVIERSMELGVDIYFCLNTAAALEIKNKHVIPGVKFVPAGLSAITDFQRAGYVYVQP